MSSEMTFLTWKKTSLDQPVGVYFNLHDYSCPCINLDCIDQKIALDLIQKLDELRKEIARPIKITSGFRCAQHQLELASRGCETAKGISQHELGMAADIWTDDLSSLHLPVQKFFKSIGFSSRFIHVDLRDDHVRHWYYKK